MRKKRKSFRNKDSIYSAKLEKNTEWKSDYIIYTDGSMAGCSDSRDGTIAYVILDGDTGTEIIDQFSDRFRHTTANKMEIMAIIQALWNIPPDSKCTVFTDSIYAIRRLCSNEENNRQCDMVNMYRRIIESSNLSVKLVWVKAHSGNKWNNYVDKLAKREYKFS